MTVEQALEAAGVRVRELVWDCVSWGGDGVEGEDDDGWEAETCMGGLPYRIDWFGRDHFRLEYPDGESVVHPTLEAARTAAKAHNRARIYAALEVAK